MTTERRKVLTSEGMKYIEVELSKSVESPTIKKVELKLEPSIEKSMEVKDEERAITPELINLMELSELKVLASNLGIKLGNRKQDSARKFLIAKIEVPEL